MAGEGTMAHQRGAVRGGVLLGLLFLVPASSADEAAAVRAVEKLGGRITRDAERPGKPVVEVDFYNSKITDAGLKVLKEFKGLKTLVLDNTEITDAGLKELKELKNLQTLELGVPNITDAGLKELKEHKSLQQLSLGYTQVTDVGLKELREHKNLQRLALRETKVTDAGPQGT